MDLPTVGPGPLLRPALLGAGRVHTTRPRRSGGLRTGRLHVHTAPLDEDEVVEHEGVVVTSVVRMLLDQGS